MIWPLSILLLVLASVADGVVEGFEFDGRRSFERKFNVSPTSFFGSLSWMNKKSWYAKNFGVFDFYHVADDVRKYGYIGGGAMFALGLIGKTQLHIFLALGLTFLVLSAAKKYSMLWIRK